jgi:hypothetical protein
MDLIKLDSHLRLAKCPHCNTNTPNLHSILGDFQTASSDGYNIRVWQVYNCSKCGCLVTAYRNNLSPFVMDFFPKFETADESLPAKPKRFLNEAIQSISLPTGAILLCAASIDSMLKDKGYSEGSLYKRIETAAEDHLITASMAEWAHQVRLDANDQRHADEDAELPTIDDAKRAISFAKAFAEYLYVLPAKVAKGISELPPSNEGVVVPG